MGYDRQKVINIALAEVGYLEKKSNSQLDDKSANAGSKNYNKYSRDLAVYPFYNGAKTGVAWCDIFVDWCFVQAYGLEAALKLTCQPTNPSVNYGAGCRWSRSYYSDKGQLFDSPQPGDQIFYYNSTKDKIAHTGLVYKVDSMYVYTVEGNTSGASGVIANGGGVHTKKYSLTYARIAGYGRPKYEDGYVPTEVKEESAVTDTLRNGSRGDAVRALQEKLNSLGYNSGAADGIFGVKTEAAVKQFQKAKGLTADGIVGVKTSAALENAKAPTVTKEPTDAEKLDALWAWYLQEIER
jgi:hypothetical protein